MKGCVVCCCLLLFVVVCCCLLLFVVVCCCLLLFVVVCCCGSLVVDLVSRGYSTTNTTTNTKDFERGDNRMRALDRSHCHSAQNLTCVLQPIVV